MDKHLLVQIHHYDNSVNATEMLDAVLAFGIFDLPIDVVFFGDGIKQLVSGLQNDSGKDLAKQWSAASFYGVDSLIVDQQSMEDTGILPSQLIESAVISTTPPDANHYKHQLQFLR